MGRLGEVLRFARFTRGDAKGSEATVDPGGGADVTAGHFTALGDDSHPLRGDYAAVVPGPGTGVELVVGYADPINTPASTPGDKIIYGRDPVTRLLVNKILLAATGDIFITTANASLSLSAAGTITANGVTIDTAGNITTTGTITAGVLAAPSIEADGLELAGHAHISAAPGVPTGPNLP